MKTKDLFKILTIVTKVYSSRWEHICNIVDIINKCTIISSSWSARYKRNNPEWYPLDLTKLTTWSTYDRTCIDLQFYNKDNKLYLDVRIYEGYNFDGSRRDCRFLATLILPKSFLNKIAHLIDCEFNDYLNDAYDNHLKLQKGIWKEEYKNTILTT